jgi:hypothetical protein
MKLTPLRKLELSKAFERGEKLLDRYFGKKWVLRVDLKKFTFTDTDHCILGHVFAEVQEVSGFNTGRTMIPQLAKLRGEEVELSMGQLSAIYYGFDGHPGFNYHESCDFLHQLWAQRLKVRQRELRKKK